MPKVAKKTTLEYVILGLLNHVPLSGYDLKKQFDNRVSYFWSEVSLSKIYPTLKKLEKRKCVSMTEVQSTNRPIKKIYSITDTGKEELIEWISVPIKISQTKHGLSFIQELLVKLYFSNLIPKKDTLTTVEEFKKWSLNTCQILSQYEDRLREVLEQDEDHRYYLLTVLLGKAIYEGVIKWSSEAYELLK